MRIENLSEDFYSAHAQRYAQVSHGFIQSTLTSFCRLRTPSGGSSK